MVLFLQLKLKQARSGVSSNRNFRVARVGVRRFKRRLMALAVMELARRTWRELGDGFAADLAASKAYYALLSLFPLAIGLVSLFSLILEADVVETEAFAFFHSYLPGSEGLFASNVEAVGNIRGLLGIVSAIGLLWSSSLLFGAISRAVNRAWDIPYDRPFYIEKPRHFIMVFSVTPLVVLSVVSTTGLQVLGNEEWPVLGGLAFLEHNGINTLIRPLPFVFSLAIFLLIYKLAPYAHTYWRYVWPGALVAALLFDVGKNVFVWYLENYAAYERIYGALASVIVLLAWTYVSGLIVVIGAEVSSEYQRMRLGQDRGQANPGRGQMAQVSFVRQLIAPQESRHMGWANASELTTASLRRKPV